MGPERNAPENFVLGFDIGSREPRFNGAGAECSGKPRNDIPFFREIKKLQWGRSGMLRKTRPGHGQAKRSMLASMGPERNAPENWIHGHINFRRCKASMGPERNAPENLGCSRRK